MYSVFSQVMTHTSAFCSVGDMSVGRQQAFEIFKRDYHENQQIEGNKNQLRQKYAEAKKLGELVNKERDVISTYT